MDGDASYRELELRYGISSSTLQRWVKAMGTAKRSKRVVSEGSTEGSTDEGPGSENLASEVKRLRDELRRSEIHNRLLNTMIDIAEEQFDIPIRKKPGARQRR